jgi:transcriptional regulator with XRE-family HTH domain
VLGEILQKARLHQRLSLRQVQQRIGLSNAHLSQIEKGAIKRPDPAILMELSELYGLDYRLIATWAGYLDAHTTIASGTLSGLALRLFAQLDPVAQRDALDYLEKLRHQTVKAADQTRAALSGGS